MNLPQDYGRDGKWVKASCSDSEAFICQVHPELFQRECDVNFQLFGDKCYMYNSKKSTFSESQEYCNNQFGSNMIMLKSETDQTNLNSFLATLEGFGGTWLGLSDHDTPGEMAWNDGDYVSYMNWGVGEPDATLQQYPGGTCAGQGDVTLDNWVTDRCGERSRFGYACQKMQGNQCPQGWSFFASTDGKKCYHFVLNGASHRDWISAHHYCDSIGAELLELNNADEQFILTTHFKDWNKAGVTRLWLGLRCSTDYTGNVIWNSQSNGHPPRYSDWGDDEPSKDCDGKPIITYYECEKNVDPRGPEYNEYYNAELKCPAGELIEILSSFFGRASTDICSVGNVDGFCPQCYYT